MSRKEFGNISLALDVERLGVFDLSRDELAEITAEELRWLLDRVLSERPEWLGSSMNALGRKRYVEITEEREQLRKELKQAKEMSTARETELLGAIDRINALVSTLIEEKEELEKDRDSRVFEVEHAYESLKSENSRVKEELEQVKEDHGKAQEQLALAQVEATELERKLKCCTGLALTALRGSESESNFLKEGDRDWSSGYGYIVDLLRGYRNTQAELIRKNKQVDMRNDTIEELNKRLQDYTQQKEAGGPSGPLEGFHVYRLCTDRLPGPDVVVHQVDGVIFSSGKHSCSIAEEGKRMVVMKKEHASVIWELMKHFAMQGCSETEDLDPPQPLEDADVQPVSFVVHGAYLEFNCPQLLLDPESVAELVDKVYLEKPGWLETTKMYQQLQNWKKTLGQCQSSLNRTTTELFNMSIAHSSKVKELEDERDMYRDAYEGLKQRHALRSMRVKLHPVAKGPSETLEDPQEQG